MTPPAFHLRVLPLENLDSLVNLTEVLGGRSLIPPYFFGNTTPGEYMGESWLVFKEILKRRETMPIKLINTIEAKMKEIKEGFKAAGQDID